MKCIILAGGKGTRMQPLTFEKPKPLLEVAGKPLLAHIMESLPAEITDIILVIGYKGDMIKKYFGDSYAGRHIIYVAQEEPLGTGHALHMCRQHIKDGERFLFMFGDDLHSKEALERLVTHKIAMLVHEHSDPSRFGVVEIASDGSVKSFEEKPEHPKSHLVSPGVFVLDSRIFDYEMRKGHKGEYFLTDQINEFMKDEKFIVEKTPFWHPIGYPEDLITAEEILRTKDDNIAS